MKSEDVWRRLESLRMELYWLMSEHRKDWIKIRATEAEIEIMENKLKTI